MSVPESTDLYDADRPLRLGCHCGAVGHVPQDCPATQTVTTPPTQQFSLSGELEARQSRMVEATLVKALFPQDSVRRRFLRAVGAGTARAAIASVLPAGALMSLQEAMAQDRPAAAGTPEKKDLKLGFIAITCATPLIMADPLGLYKQQGLNVQLVKTAGWGAIRDGMLNRQLDATHFLSPMPLAMSLGLGSPAAGMHVASIQNTNGQAITLSLKHKDNRDPKKWKGMKLGIPFEFSIHNLLLRHTFATLYRAIISSSLLASQPGARDQVVKAIAPAAYLNQPEELLTQIMTGKFTDGLGNNRSVPDRVLFDPVPWQSMAVWMLTQLKRWGYIKGEVNYAQLAEKVFLLTDAKRQMAQAGWRAPDGAYRTHRIMGKAFDATKPDDYLKSFAIRSQA